jgi:hypothetical protein
MPVGVDLTTGEAIYDDPKNIQWQQRQRDNGRPKRKRGPGTVWQYPEPTSDAHLLTLPADAITAGMTNAHEIERMICEALHWIPLDPETKKQNSATMSGRALEWLHKKQIDYDDDVRGDFAENALLPVVDMLLRLIVIFSKRKQKLYLPGFDKMAAILARFEHVNENGVAGSATTWVTPRMSVIWSDYFEASETEQKAVVDTALALKAAGMLKSATVIKRIAPYFDIVNPAQYADNLEEAAEEKAKKAAEALAAQPPPPVPIPGHGVAPPPDQPPPKARGAAPEVAPPRPSAPRAAKPPKPPVERKARAGRLAQASAASLA